MLKVADFIEDSMDQQLGLKGISSYCGYSKYHFHRLFLKEMGTSVFDYIKRRRLHRSLYYLSDMNRLITEIALEVGFNNVDTFTRAFKAYYGVTPSAYRIRLRAMTMEGGREVMSDRIDLVICNKRDKEKAIVAMDRVIELSKLAHKRGLLDLEKSLEDQPSILWNESKEYGPLVFLNKAIELLLNGTKQQRLKRILNTYVGASELSDLERLECAIYSHGILLIHEGAYPWVISEELKALFGIEFVKRLDEYYDNKTDVDAVASTFINSRVEDCSFAEFNKAMKKIQERSMQRFLRDCDVILIAIALMGTTVENCKILLEALPRKKYCNVIEALELMKGLTKAQIIDAQCEMIKGYQELRLNGDVI